MQKEMVWAVCLTVVWCCGLATAASGEEVEMKQNQREVIEIEVKAGSIGYVNKDSRPIPELTFGSPFQLTVHWVDPVIDSLTLSEFRLVAFDPNAYATGSVIWPPDPDYRLELQDDHGTPMRSVSLDYSGASTTTVTLILKREMTVEVLRESFRERLETPQLILFTVNARADDTEFVLDPPWVGKPPTG